MLANLVFWRLMLFYTHVLLLLQPSVLWLSIATFNNDAKPPPERVLLEFDVLRIGSDLGITQCHSYPICRYKHVSAPKKIVLRYDRRRWKIDRGCVKYRETNNTGLHI